jgi:hypothetical protein
MAPILAVALAGCQGDLGPTGATGPTGAAGAAGAAGTAGTTPVITVQDATTCGPAGGKDLLANGTVLTTVCNPAVPRVLLVNAAWAAANAGTASGAVADVPSDGAPGYEIGSIRATGTAKAELYFRPSDLFPSHPTVTLGDIARISFWTKKGASLVVDENSWYLNIYTAKYSGQSNTHWYGACIGAVPYKSTNIDETVGAWNLWSTDGSTNQLNVYDSTDGVTATLPIYSWSAFLNAPAPASGAYSGQQIMYFTMATNSLDHQTDEQLDGVRIELTDGTVAELDLQ